MSVDPARFRSAMSAFVTGVTVVTVRGRDGVPYGMTVNAFTSVSLEPPLVLVCLARSGRGRDLIAASRAFGVNVLAESQQDLSRWFADRRRAADADMFAHAPARIGSTGCPVLLGAVASFDCRVRNLVEAGDHSIVLGEVVAVTHRPETAPLVFHGGGYRTLAGDARQTERARLRAV